MLGKEMGQSLTENTLKASLTCSSCTFLDVVFSCLTESFASQTSDKVDCDSFHLSPPHFCDRMVPGKYFIVLAVLWDLNG
jgi:hypothetical protein